MEKLSFTFREMAGILRAGKKGSSLILITLFLLFCTAALTAQEAAPGGVTDSGKKEKAEKKNYQRIIPLSSPIYGEMDRLYLLAGKSRPSTSRPWSAEEAGMLLAGIREQGLSAAGEKSLSIVKAEITSGNGKTGEKKAAFRVTKKINIEGYYKTNDDREEWEHGYEEREPLLSIPVEGWFFTNLYSTLDLTMKEEYAVIEGEEDNYLNIPSSLTEFDWYFPFRAFISLGGENWNIEAGRDQASWGAGTTGNLMLSDYSEFYNLIRFTTYWERFKFTAVYIGLDAWLTGEEKEIDADATEDGTSGLAGGYQNFEEMYKAFLGHRVEFRIRDNLSLALSESIIFGNKYINMTELNPVFVFHNLFSPEYSNAMMSLEADYTPFSGLNLYVQFVMDEFQVPGYESNDSRPGATGLLSGFTIIRPSENGYMTYRAEAALTEPYLYNRWHPLTRFTNRRRIWSTYLDRYEYINKPLGYEFGPDAVILYGAAEYDRPGQFSASVDARYSMKGEMNSSLDDPSSYDTGKEASRLGILSGTVERELAAGIHGTIKPGRMLSISSDIYWIHIDNYENISGEKINDIEIALSAGLTF